MSPYAYSNARIVLRPATSVSYTHLITSQSGQPVMLTVSINIENNTIKSWNQITPINNSFGIQSVNIEEGGIQVKFNSVGVWGVCQYWGTGISI